MLMDGSWIMDNDSNQNTDTYEISGVALPLVFREKLRALEANAVAGGGLDSNRGRSDEQDRVFTVAELESKLKLTSQAIVNLQRQIVRGEETYYEETQQAHGSNLFRGFDSYIDSRAPSSTVGHTLGDRPSHHSTSAPRRMPGDYRWFSSSCSNIAKYIKAQGANAAVSSSTTGSSSFPDLHVEVVNLSLEQIEAHEQAKKKKREEQQQKEGSQSKSNTETTGGDVDGAVVSREKRPLSESDKTTGDETTRSSSNNNININYKKETPQKMSRSGSTSSGVKNSAGRPSRKRKASS